MNANERSLTVADVLDDAMLFEEETLSAMADFRDERPWRGGPEDRLAKLVRLNEKLAEVYAIPVPLIVVEAAAPELYRGMDHMILLRPNLSVVSYLHLFARARGLDFRGALRWSINLFKRSFPASYARLRPVGYCLVRAD